MAPSGPSWRLRLVSLLLIMTVNQLQVITGQTQCQEFGQADIMFVIDSSGSVGSSGFSQVINFIKSIVSQLQHVRSDGSGVRIGAMSYGSSNQIRFGPRLNQALSNEAVRNAIAAMSYTGGGTDTAAALNRAGTEFQQNGRNGVPRIVITLTDGFSNSETATINAANNLRSSLGCHLMSVGIGSSLRNSELVAMADTPAMKFLVNDFGVLTTIITRVKTALFCANIKRTCAPKYGPVCPFDCHCGDGACTTDTCSVSCASVQCAFGDISRNKAVRQSSSRTSANKAIDGTYATDNEATCSETLTRSTMTNPWWRIDFGSQHVVYGVYVYNHIITNTDPETNRLGHFQIRVGDSETRPAAGQLFSNSNPMCKDYNKFVPETLTIAVKPYAWVECGKPLLGRYLSIQNKDGVSRGSQYSHVLNICEVDIRGYKVCQDSTKSGKNCDVFGCWCWNNNCGNDNVLGYCTDGCKKGRIGKFCMEEVAVPMPTVYNVKPTEVNATWKVPIFEGSYIDSYKDVTLGYKLQYRALTTSQWIDNTAEIIENDNTRLSTLSNLDANTVYEIRVMMTKTALGNEREAASSGIVSNCAVPKAVNVTSTIRCTNDTNGVEVIHVDISWLEDKTHPPCLGSIIKFDMEYAELGSNFTKNSDVTSPFKITPASANTTYEFRLRAWYQNPQLSTFYSYSNGTVTIGKVPAPDNFTLISSPGDSHKEFRVNATWKQRTSVCPRVVDIRNYVWYRVAGDENAREEVLAVPRGRMLFTINKLNMSRDYQVRLEARSPDGAGNFTAWKRPKKPIVKEPEPLPIGSIAGGGVAGFLILVAVIGVVAGLVYYYRFKSTRPESDRYPRMKQPVVNELDDFDAPTKVEAEQVQIDNPSFNKENDNLAFVKPDDNKFAAVGFDPPIIASPPPRDPNVNPKKDSDLGIDDEYAAYIE